LTSTKKNGDIRRALTSVSFFLQKKGFVTFSKMSCFKASPAPTPAAATDSSNKRPFEGGNEVAPKRPNFTHLCDTTVVTAEGWTYRCHLIDLVRASGESPCFLETAYDKETKRIELAAGKFESEEDMHHVFNLGIMRPDTVVLAERVNTMKLCDKFNYLGFMPWVTRICDWIEASLHKFEFDEDDKMANTLYEFGTRYRREKISMAGARSFRKLPEDKDLQLALAPVLFKNLLDMASDIKIILLEHVTTDRARVAVNKKCKVVKITEASTGELFD
jgi:hypothetical protein